jgi:hypothetical protein
MKLLPDISCRDMHCMPIVTPKNKIIALQHETVIEIVNRVHLQSANELRSMEAQEVRA